VSEPNARRAPAGRQADGTGATVGQLNQQRAARVLTVLNPRKTYHRASIQHVERIPVSGAAMLVSNHGRLVFDAFILSRLILRARGRLTRVMADHMWFRLPPFDRIFRSAGAVDGTRDNAADLLRHGELVLTYPGGVPEVLGGRFGREHIDWDGRCGFARVAIDAGVPVIPIVSVGVNNGLVFVSKGRLLGKLVFQHLLRLGPSYAEYRNPLALGIIPVPLPLSVAVAFPLPCRVTYVVGEPLYPPARAPEEVAGREAEQFAGQVADAMWQLIERHGRSGRVPKAEIVRASG
jgi:1-acyl-sn-glycerol-3-phosphate acyltransferase